MLRSVASNAGGGGGSGDVVGPASATDNAIVRFDATTGKLVQNSVITITDAGLMASTASFSPFIDLGTLVAGVVTIGRIATPSSIDVTIGNPGSGLIGVHLNPTGVLAWGSTGNPSVSTDLVLTRDAANIMAQRNGTTAQVFRVYGTRTDASNGDWLNITKVAGGAATITTAANGTGAQGQLVLNGTGVLVQNAGVARINSGTVGITFTTSASGTADSNRFNFTGSSDLTLTASTESFGFTVDFSQTRQHATGALTLQRDIRFLGSTHSFVAASTLTDLASVSVEYGNGGTFATITNLSAILVQTRALTGATNGYGINVAAPTGATRNYAARFAGPVQYQNYTVATLPTVQAYTRAFATDATQTMTAGIGAIVAGGGANTVPVYYDGTNWRIG
jgi:hypothetical protein